MLSSFNRLTRQLHHGIAAAMPSSCALCGVDAKEALCEGCQLQFLREHPARCVQCANTLPHALAHDSHVCGSCLNDPPAFDATIVAANYTAPIDQLVLSLKFAGQLALAPLFANLLHASWQREQRDALPSLLTIVPLGSERLIQRGFNQALEIARPLGRALALPLLPQLVSRVRETVAQSSLPPEERRKNVRRAFTLSNEAAAHIKGEHVGVVDDVMTTGETLHELAATLKKGGAARVTNFVFARAPL
ncbi:MAG: ComF family protein [Oxalobacter sp.]|nr:MAG: ComF family protein [Oxalobacter sp.]